MTTKSEVISARKTFTRTAIVVLAAAVLGVIAFCAAGCTGLPVDGVGDTDGGFADMDKDRTNAHQGYQPQIPTPGVAEAPAAGGGYNPAYPPCTVDGCTAEAPAGVDGGAQ